MFLRTLKNIRARNSQPSLRGILEEWGPTAIQAHLGFSVQPWERGMRGPGLKAQSPSKI